jgi:hypothetical protein
MVDQDEQDTSTFAYNAFASLAKAVAFRSIAIQSLKANERISATVSAYYSLLHLAITLIYLCPDKVEVTLRDRLRAERGQGAIDPSSLISHNSALKFIQRCIQSGLDNRFYAQLEFAKKLREFVNYGPRLTIINDTPNFGPCTNQPGDCNKLISSIDEIFPGALIWACSNSPLNGCIAKEAVLKCSDFFVQPDLFYRQWCSSAGIEESLKFIQALKQNIIGS